MSGYLTGKKIWLGLNEPLSTQSSCFLWVLQKLQFNNNPFYFSGVEYIIVETTSTITSSYPTDKTGDESSETSLSEDLLWVRNRKMDLKLSLHYLSVQKCFFNKTIPFLSFWFSVIYAFAGVCGMVDNKSEWPCIEWHTRCTALSLRGSDIVPLNHAATVNW
jgi:hypothetical protein